MKKSMGSWQLRGFVFAGALGTFLHFLYDLSGENILAGLVSAVNESVWEHEKLLFYPMVLFTVLTFVPPQIPLFKDPVTGTYGIWGGVGAVSGNR